MYLDLISTRIWRNGGAPSALVVKGTYAVLCVALMSPQWKPEMLTILANDH